MHNIKFPMAFEDHWGQIHVLLSPAKAKELWFEYCEDGMDCFPEEDTYSEYMDKEIKDVRSLLASAEVSDDPEDWVKLMDRFTNQLGDECWMLKSVTVYP